MIVVIIAGGAGTRLWPLSTPEYPKHLLKINGDRLSLLQQTYNRAKLLTDDVYVVSEASHSEHVKNQLPDLKKKNFIIEPARRGTANCIVFALAYIAKHHKPEEPIVTLWADHYIRDNAGFVHSFKVAAEESTKEKKIVLIGAEPTYPATGFGYIEKADLLNEEDFVFRVRSFKEKPSIDLAEKYVKNGSYLWNCGYFVATFETFTNAMKKYSPELYDSYQALSKATDQTRNGTYLSLNTNSIDYALIERVQDLLVVPASFDWVDLGSFNDLHKALGGDRHGNNIYGSNVETDGVENSYIHNHGEKPVAVIGLDNVVVINTPQGILVARKDLSQNVGEISKRFK